MHDVITGVKKTRDVDHRRGAYFAVDDQGREWFAKPPHPSIPGRFRFAEVAVSMMAVELGLRWPLTVPHLFPTGQGLLSAMIPGAKQPLIQFGHYPSDWETLLARGDNLDHLAGFTVFSRWTDASDTKGDVLQLDQLDRFWFLDGEHYLGNKTDNDWVFSQGYCRGAAFNGFWFTDAVKGKPLSLFQPWLQRLSSLANTFDLACTSVPADWLPAGLDGLRLGLFGDNGSFEAYFAGAVKDESGESPWPI